MEFAEGDHASDFRSLAFWCQGIYLVVLMGFISPSARLGEDGIVITCTNLLVFSSAFRGVGIKPLTTTGLRVVAEE